jgi:hypothetical protein
MNISNSKYKNADITKKLKAPNTFQMDYIIKDEEGLDHT